MTAPSVVVAPTTPFTSSREVDLRGAENLYATLADAGVDGIFVGGSAGEFAALTLTEREQLISSALQFSDRMRVIAHVGAITTADTVRLARYAVGAGATELGCITPWFWRVGNPELERHFRTVAAAAADAAIYLYSRPVVALNRIDADLARRLADVENIVGAKVSIVGVEAMRELMDASAGRWQIFCGEDESDRAACEAGCVGIVTGPGSALPEPYVALAGALAAGDGAAAELAQSAIDDFMAVTGGGSIAMLKLAQELRGRAGGPTRALMPVPTAADRERLGADIERILAIIGSPEPRAR